MKPVTTTILAIILATIPSQSPAQQPSAAIQSSQPESAPSFEAQDGILEGAKDLIQAAQEIQNLDTQTPSTEEPIQLTAHQAVTIALRQNPQTLTAEDEVQAAQARTGQARSALFPTITAATAYNYQENAGQSFTQSLLTDLIAPGTGEIKEITRTDQLTISQTLYTGGQTQATIKASKYLAQSQQWRRQTTLHTLEFQVKQAYYDCLLAKALIKVAEESVNTFERHLADTQKMLDVGLVSRVEVLRAQTEVGSRKAGVIEAKNRQRLAYAILKRHLAIPQDTPLILAGTITWRPLESTPAQLVQQAQHQRPETRALQAAIDAAQQQTKAAKAQYWPRIAAKTQWTALDGAGSFTPEGWTATLGAQWDLHTGGRRKHQLREAKAAHRSLQHQHADITLIIELEVHQAYIQVQDAIAKIKRESDIVTLARESQRLAALRFREGLHTQADVLDAELALTNAETQLVVALRTYAVSHAALDKATANSWVTPPELPPT